MAVTETRNEIDILCRLCALHLGVPADVKGLAAGTASWDKFQAAAKRENIEGLVYHVMRENAILNAVPDWISSHLLNGYLKTKAKNLLFADELKRTADILGSGRIRAVIIKGAAYLKYCYPDRGLRVMDDIDLVVDGAAYDKARNCLISRGYRSDPNYESKIFSPCGVLFDMHRDAFDADRIRSREYYCRWDMDDVWEKSVPYAPDGKYVRYVSPVDQIVLSCVHHEKHSYTSLMHFLDIAVLARGLEGKTCSGEFLERVRRTGGARAVYFNFALIKRLFGLDIKLVDADDLLDRPLSMFEKKIFARAANREKIGMAGTIMPVFGIKGGRRKLIYLLENIFPRPRTMREIYNIRHNALLICYYPYRLIKLALGRKQSGR
ncbi:nucleotidyltransferase family protein [Candidatus Auribacterota bacterium]